MGPMTGRAAGYCGGFPVPGYMNPMPGLGFWGFGRGFGRRGGGRGWRHWYYATGLPAWARGPMMMPSWGMGYYPWAAAQGTPVDELTMLKEQSEMLAQQLEAVKERMAELEREKEEK